MCVGRYSSSEWCESSTCGFRQETKMQQMCSVRAENLMQKASVHGLVRNATRLAGSM